MELYSVSQRNITSIHRTQQSKLHNYGSLHDEGSAVVFQNVCFKTDRTHKSDMSLFLQ